MRAASLYNQYFNRAEIDPNYGIDYHDRRHKTSDRYERVGAYSDLKIPGERVELDRGRIQKICRYYWEKTDRSSFMKDPLIEQAVDDLGLSWRVWIGHDNTFAGVICPTAKLVMEWKLANSTYEWKF